MNVLDLFSGIGGFSLGLERAGMRTVAFCEIDPFCRRVLSKHWPSVPIYDDITTLTADRLAADGITTFVPDATGGRRNPSRAGPEQTTTDRPTDRPERLRQIGIELICGGFPCQDISVAGKGAGIAGERSGLWSEYARIIGELRPRYVIVENVAAILGRGIQRVLGDLAALGFDAEWHCIPASAVGALHRRDRWWAVAHAPINRRVTRRPSDAPEGSGGREFSRGSIIADMADAHKPRLEIRIEGNAEKCSATLGRGWWSTEPDVGRVAHGVPARVDRLRALGNAVVPQIPEIIGRAIMRIENAD